jgi:hypothetical protein
MKMPLSLFFISCLFVMVSYTQETWEAKLDSKIGFYQSTDFGILLAGTEKAFTPSTDRLATWSGAARRAR